MKFILIFLFIFQIINEIFSYSTKLTKCKENKIKNDSIECNRLLNNNRITKVPLNSCRLNCYQKSCKSICNLLTNSKLFGIKRRQVLKEISLDEREPFQSNNNPFETTEASLKTEFLPLIIKKTKIIPLKTRADNYNYEKEKKKNNNNDQNLIKKNDFNEKNFNNINELPFFTKESFNNQQLSLETTSNFLTKKWPATLTPPPLTTTTTTTNAFKVSEIFSTLKPNLETVTFESFINFGKINNQFILTKNIHSPAPPKIYPPGENIGLTNINFPPSIAPKPPGYSIDTATKTFTTSQPTFENTPNFENFGKATTSALKKKKLILKFSENYDNNNQKNITPEPDYKIIIENSKKSNVLEKWQTIKSSKPWLLKPKSTTIQPNIISNTEIVENKCPPPPLCERNCGIYIDENGCQGCKCLWIASRCSNDFDCKGRSQYCDIDKCNCIPGYEYDEHLSGVCQPSLIDTFDLDDKINHKNIGVVLSSNNLRNGRSKEMSSFIQTHLHNSPLNKRIKRSEIKTDQLKNKKIKRKNLTKSNLIPFEKDIIYNTFWMPGKPLQEERLQWPGPCEIDEDCPPNLYCLQSDCWVVPDKSLINNKTKNKKFNKNVSFELEQTQMLSTTTIKTNLIPLPQDNHKTFLSIQNKLNSEPKLSSQTPPSFLFANTNNKSKKKAETIEKEKLKLEPQKHINKNDKTKYLFKKLTEVSIQNQLNSNKLNQSETNKNLIQSNLKNFTLNTTTESFLQFDRNETTPLLNKKDITRLSKVLLKNNLKNVLSNNFLFNNSITTVNNNNNNNKKIWTKNESDNKLLFKFNFLNQSNLISNSNKLINDKFEIDKQQKQQKTNNFSNDSNENLFKTTQTSMFAQKIFYDYSMKNRLEKPVRVELKNAKSIVRNECKTDADCGSNIAPKKAFNNSRSHVNVMICCLKQWCDLSAQCGMANFCLPDCRLTKMTHMSWASVNEMPLLDLIYD